jgi:hypothetical protein
MHSLKMLLAIETQVAGLKSGHTDEHVGQSVRCTLSTR